MARGLWILVLVAVTGSPPANAQTVPVATDPVWESGPAGFTQRVTVADVDRDGRLDLLCANVGANSLFAGNGTAFATTSSWQGGAATSLAIAAGDIDGDGDPDVACGTSQGIALYINDDGTLARAPVWVSALTDPGADLALGDIDGDGDLDLVAARSLGGVTVYRNDGGAFAEPPLWSDVSSRVNAVALGDVDGDGLLDLACGNFAQANTLFLNTGTTLAAAPVWSSDSTLSTTAVAFGDLDGDGRLDLVCANHELNTAYPNLGATLATAPAWLSATARVAMSMDLGDIDGDGDLDAAFGNDGDVSDIYLNQGGALAATPAWSSSRAGVTTGIVLADIDGDGDLDVVSGNRSQTNTAYRNLSPPFAADPEWLSTLQNSTFAVALSDLDGDGRLDLVCGNQLANTVYPGGGAPFATSPSWTGSSGETTYGVAMGDLDGDGRPDLVCANATADAVYFNNGGQLSTVAGWSSPDDAATTAVALGDLNGDGSPDLVFTDTGGENRLYPNDQGAIAGTPYWTSPSADAADVALADVDEDGDIDIVFANTNDIANTLFRNDRAGINAAWSSNLAAASSGVALGDVDGDGVVDAVFANFQQSNSLYLGDGSAFALDPDWSSGPLNRSTSVALGDVDGDGDLDAVFGNYSEGNTLYLNDAGILATTPAWQSARDAGTDDVALGDVDGDGDLDAVFGNQNAASSPTTGENTAYLGRHNPPAAANRAVNSPAFVSSARVRETAVNERRIYLTVTDAESDPVRVLVEYQFEGEHIWRRAAVGSDGLSGALASSPAGAVDSLTWDIAPLPIDRRGVVLRLRTLETPARVSTVRRIPAYVKSLGPVTPLRAEMSLSPGTLVFPTVTAGDTAVAALTIANTGNAYLAVTDVSLPSPEMFLNVQILPVVAPGGSEEILVYLSPIKESGVTGPVVVTSDDPLQPVDSVDVATDIRALEVTSRLLTGRDEIPLGEAATVIVEPLPGVRVEGGDLYSRAAGTTAFTGIRLGPSGSDLVGLIPGALVKESGVEYYVEVYNSGVLATDPPGAPKDSLYFQAVLPPTGVASIPRPTAGSDFIEGQSIRVDVDLPQGAVFSAGTLYYRIGGDDRYTPTSISVEFAVPSATIPFEDVGSRGLDYWMEVQTATATLFDPPSGAQRPHSIPILIPNLVEPDRHPGGQYRLFSVPMEMDGSILGALADELGGIDNTRWRLFGYHNLAGAYVELPSQTQRQFTLGEAYWLVTREAHRIGTGDDVGRTTSTAEPYGMLLRPGYNLVGTPFNFPIEWGEAMIDTFSVLDTLAAAIIEPPVGWTADGYDYNVKTLIPFDGYWIHNISGAPHLLKFPARAPSAQNAPAAADETGWRLTVTASADGAVDALAELGGGARTQNAWDRFDRSLPPPPPGQALGVCFPHGEWEEYPGRYARDLRPVAPRDGTVWWFDVAKSYSIESGGDAVTLSIDGAGALGDGVRAVLIDRRLGKRVNPGDDYRFFLPGHEAAPTSDRARFAVIVGNDAFVTSRANELIERPARSVLHQNHPNPFNPATVIRYDLADAARVDLRIYDVRGALVRVLEARDRRPGRYEVGWDGTDDRGARVASGVYFYRLEAGRFSATRKMVLLK